MKAFVIAAVVAASVAGAAQAAGSISDLQYLKAARCRGLAGSENLGKLDTASLDALLRTETGTRDQPIQASASNRMASARKEADGAAGDKKTKLIAERDSECAAFLSAAK